MSTSKRLRIGIIGCGRIAESKHIPSLLRTGRVDLTAFCDILPERAEMAARKYGTPGAIATTDYREMLCDPNLDAVHVCTPNRSHAQITIDALHAGKSVMCEKPMAKDVHGARMMLQAARETGKLLTIGYQNRYRPEVAEAKRLAAAGDLGEIYYARALALRRRGTPTWGVFLDEAEQGGGPLIDIGTHALDLALYIMDNYEPRLVVGSCFKKLPNPNCGNVWGPWDPALHTVEDSAFGFIVMKNGATISLETSWALNIPQADEAHAIFCGTRAGAEIGDRVLTLNGDRDGKLYTDRPVLGYDADHWPVRGEIEAQTWVRALAGEGELTVKPEQALVVSEILEAIYTSAKTGRAIEMG